MPPELGMPEDAPQPAMGYDESGEDAGEVLSQSLLAGKEVKPGDVITLLVKSINDEDGTFTATANDSESSEGGGINDMAMAFDQ